MRPHPDHVPDKPKPPKLKTIRVLNLKGSGEIVLHLNGTGRIKVRRGRSDHFRFEGRGLPRHISSEEILLDRATGKVFVRGMTIQVEFGGGNAEIEVNGIFEGDAGNLSRVARKQTRKATRGDSFASAA